MVRRCSRSRLENTARTLNVAQCFRVTPSTPFVLNVLPLIPSPLTQGAFVASTETHSVQVSSARKGVSHRLHQPTLHLPWDSLVSQPLPNDFSAFPFSGEEVARPCIREWFRVWSRSQPAVLSTPATSCAFLAAVVLRICNVQLPVVPRSSLLGSMLTYVHSSVHPSMRTPFD